jgi:hypothetical protein
MDTQNILWWKRIMEYLVNNNINLLARDDLKHVKTQGVTKWFYLPHYNLCIEYDGEHHYPYSKYEDKYLDKIKINDKIKNEWCLINNIILNII